MLRELATDVDLREAGDLDDLASRGMTRDNSNAVARDSERFSDRRFYGSVGLAAFGRHRYSYLERVAKPSRDARPR